MDSPGGDRWGTDCTDGVGQGVKEEPAISEQLRWMMNDE